jgi:DNA-binding beta-propeller fold protein YncE
MARATGKLSIFLITVFVFTLAASCGDDEEPGPAAGGRFWVIDQRKSVVNVYDYDGGLIFSVGYFHFFMKPNCVDVDRRDGSAWVLDYYANKLRKFDSDGKLLLEAGEGEGKEPLVKRGTSIAVDQKTGACWVADRSHFRVLKIGAEGSVLATVTGFDSPRAVALVPATGDCWVADELGQRVVKLPGKVAGAAKADAVALATCGGFETPWYVAADASGGVWVLDKDAGAVVKVSAAGARDAEVTGFGFPYAAVASRGADSVFVADYERGLLVSFRRKLKGTWSADEVVELTLKGFSYPTDVELDEDGGYLFVASSGALRRYSTAGELLYEYGGMDSPVAVAADPGR